MLLQRYRAEYDRREDADHFRRLCLVDSGGVGNSVLDRVMSVANQLAEQASGFSLTGENVGEIAERSGVAGILVGLGMNNLGVSRLRRVLRHSAEDHRHGGRDR